MIATDGPDVIVGNGALSIQAGAGDDRICVTGDDAPVLLDAGDGDDVVQVDPEVAQVRATLGSGADRYDSPGNRVLDHVTAGKKQWNESTGTDTDPDVISTGGGNDTVVSGPGPFPDMPAQPKIDNADRIDLGAGHDFLTWDGIQVAPGAVMTYASTAGPAPCRSTAPWSPGSDASRT